MTVCPANTDQPDGEPPHAPVRARAKRVEPLLIAPSAASPGPSAQARPHIATGHVTDQRHSARTMPGVDDVALAGQRDFASLLHGSVTAWVVLAVSLLLTAAAWFISNEYMERRTVDRFAFRTDEVMDAVRQRMLAYEQVLRGGVGLFNASRSVNREEWHEYVQTLRIDQNYPGIQGMGVSVPVAADELDAHIAAIRAEGFADYSVRPQTPRENYHAIIYLEPFDWRNRRAFGFDMYSNPVRRAAMQRAIDTGLPTISSVVTLVQETERDVQKGFLFYLPIYAKGSDVETSEQRRAAFRGFVYAAFRANDLMRGILGTGVPDVHLRIFDGELGDPQALLFDSMTGATDEPVETTSGLSAATPIDMAGHRWTLQVDARPEFVAANDSVQSMAVAFGGLTVDVLLFLIINSIARQRRRALRLAEVMTQDLRQNEERFRAVSDTAHDAILTAGPDGGIVYSNPSATRMFGLAPEQLQGKPLSVLIDVEHNPESGLVFEALLSGPRGEAATGVVEVSALRRDGSGFPVEISVSRWHAEEGSFVAVTLRDITQRKEMDEERAEYTAELERSNKELDDFAYVASHDLKAPLRAVDNLASWIDQDAAEALPQKSREHLSRLRGRVRRMEGLLDDLLRYSRAGRVLGEQSEVDVAGLVDEVVSLVSPPPGFDVRCSSHVGSLQTYRTPLRQVLQNLLGNALKHHDRDSGSITVGCERRGEWLEFVVCDDGPGIAPEFHERVFGMFQTLRSRDEVEASGMGLAIVRKIIESQGGHIVIEAAPSRGTLVRFTWPERVTSVEHGRLAACAG